MDSDQRVSKELKVQRLLVPQNWQDEINKRVQTYEPSKSRKPMITFMSTSKELKAIKMMAMVKVDYNKK